MGGRTGPITGIISPAAAVPLSSCDAAVCLYECEKKQKRFQAGYFWHIGRRLVRRSDETFTLYTRTRGLFIINNILSPALSVV